jgi:hypothetical protein
MKLLVESGQARSTIVLQPDASPAERFAATELQSHLARISGAQVPIAPTASAVTNVISIGRTAAENLMAHFDWDTLGEDGCLVSTVENGLVLAGTTPRSTLYAVYEFLEEVLGCRWLTAQTSHIPRLETIEVSDLYIAHKPPFRYREPFFSIAENGDWAARNRTNGAHAELDEAHGGKWVYAGFVHTFYELVPPDIYFASHPEYYSEIDGERTGNGAQLCLTNAELVDVVAANARVRLQAEPQARIFSISQNDWYGNCQCARCRALDEAEGSPSGAIVRFVNAVAEKLEPEFPHVFFDTLAYTYSVAPPLHARPRHNVIIRLCHMSPCCDGHPLEACEINRPFLHMLQRWGEIAPEVFVWDYFTNFLHYFMPFPNLDLICADVPAFARSGVTGLFCQADGEPTKGCGEFAELRAYLLAKLMWRPERDGEQIVDEFLRLYYGPAAEPIRAYIDLIHTPVRESSAHFDLYCNLEQPFLTTEVMAHAEHLFDEAARLVEGDAVLSERVAAARLPVDYIHLKRNAQYVVKANRLEPAEPDVTQRAEQFFARAAAHGARALREGGRPFHAELTALRGYDLVTLENESLQLVIGPAIGGRLLSLLDKNSDTEWLHAAPIHANDYPFCGGYEEYSEAKWHSPGWSEDYHCELTKDTAHLSANLSNGLKIERSYYLDSEANPTVVIKTKLTNATNAPVEVALRTHPELAANMKNSTIHLRTKENTSQAWAPWRDAENAHSASGSAWLKEGEVPHGNWLLASDGRGLQMEFESEKIAKCLVDWRSNDGVVSMELFSHAQQLEPNQTTRFMQRWTLVSV